MKISGGNINNMITHFLLHKSFNVVLPHFFFFLFLYWIICFLRCILSPKKSLSQELYLNPKVFDLNNLPHKRKRKGKRRKRNEVILILKSIFFLCLLRFFFFFFFLMVEWGGLLKFNRVNHIWAKYYFSNHG